MNKHSITRRGFLGAVGTAAAGSFMTSEETAAQTTLQGELILTVESDILRTYLPPALHNSVLDPGTDPDATNRQFFEIALKFPATVTPGGTPGVSEFFGDACHEFSYHCNGLFLSSSFNNAVTKASPKQGGLTRTISEAKQLLDTGKIDPKAPTPKMLKEAPPVAGAAMTGLRIGGADHSIIVYSNEPVYELQTAPDGVDLNGYDIVSLSLNLRNLDRDLLTGLTMEALADGLLENPRPLDDVFSEGTIFLKLVKNGVPDIYLYLPLSKHGIVATEITSLPACKNTGLMLLAGILAAAGIGINAKREKAAPAPEVQ